MPLYLLPKADAPVCFLKAHSYVELESGYHYIVHSCLQTRCTPSTFPSFRGLKAVSLRNDALGVPF